MTESRTQAPVPDGERRRAATETERIVMDVWRDVFELDDVSLDDDVLELGVDSMAAVEMCLRLERLFGAQVTPAKLLIAPTVAGLAALIDENRPA